MSGSDPLEGIARRDTTLETDYWRRLSPSGRLSRRAVLRGGAVAGAGLAGAALIGCGGSEEPAATPAPTQAPSTSTAPTAAPTAADPHAGIKRGGIYKNHITGDPPTIDPYGNLSFLTKGFAAYVYSRLFLIPAEPNVNPTTLAPVEDLAAGVETTDGQHWVVKLKPGVKFQNVAPVNGRELTSEDVKFSWDRLTAEGSPGANLVAGIGMEVVDSHTMRFTTSGPSPTFIETLADANVLWVMPKESGSAFDPTQKAVGSGPWILERYDVSQMLSFKKNPDWHWDGRPYLDGVDVAVIPEYPNSLAQLQAGNLHILQILADDVLTLRRDRPEFQWSGELPISLSHIYFSPEDMDPDAPWRDERFRRAISMAIPRDEMTELLFNISRFKDAGLEVTEGWNNVIPIGFGDFWHLSPQAPNYGESAKWFEYNPDEARKLLDAMGAAGAKFKYQYTNNRYGARFNIAAEAVGNWIADIGLMPETETQDYNSVYITQTFRGNFNGVALGPETPFPEPGGWVERLFGRDPANHGRINDPVLNDLNAKQKVELSREARRELIHEVQRYNSDKMYYVPTQLGAGENWIAFSPALRGYRRTRGYGGPTESTAHFWLDS
jgi:peptide/nickel transport system substrate-binding protein